MRENNRPERGSNSRPLTLYVKCSTAELLGRAFKPTPKAESPTRTAPVFYRLHRGAIAAPSQSAEDLKSERGLPTPGRAIAPPLIISSKILLPLHFLFNPIQWWGSDALKIGLIKHLLISEETLPKCSL